MIKTLFNKIWHHLTFQIFLLIASLGLIIMHRYDELFRYNHLIFTTWLVIFLLASSIFIVKHYHTIVDRKVFDTNDEWLLIGLVLFFAVGTRILFLGKYPYVTVFDELRDAGLNGLYIKKGLIQDAFAFGSYDGYGNMIPYFSYLFQFIFPASRFAYILPSAIVGIFSIVCTYILGRKLAGRIGGFIGAMFLTASVFHLHYSRTELVIIFDTLLSPILILAVVWAIRDKSAYYLLGLLFGFSMHLYAGLRGVMISCAVFLVVRSLFHLIRPIVFDDWTQCKKELKLYSIALIFFVAGLVIGIGPTINNLKSNTVMSNTGATQFIFKNPEFLNRTSFGKIQYLYHEYEQSFLTYVITPIGSHFPYKEVALLSFPVNIFFIIGLGYLILDRSRKNSLHYLLTFTILLFPFTNQVLINDFTADHRMMSIIPLLNIIGAYGLIKLTDTKLPKLAPFIVGAIAGLFFITQILFYFYGRPTDTNYDGAGTKEYILQSMIEYTRNLPDDRIYYVVNNQPYDYNYAHYKEKMEYLLYPKQMNIVEKSTVPELVALEKQEHKKIALLYVDSLAALDSINGEVVTVHCDQGKLIPNYYCPKNWLSDYSFNVARID